MDDFKLPSETQIRFKETVCPRCTFYIKTPVYDNQHLGISEPITERSNLSKIIESQNTEYSHIADALASNITRAKVLYNRCEKYKKILGDWAMLHDDRQLLDFLEKVDGGEFDRI